MYGHSYVAYGRLDWLGRPMTTTYADIHPTGDLPSMVLGHFFPMEAATIPEKDTLHYEIASRFRQPLTAAEYGALQSVIDHIRAAHHSWSVLAYNCNDFVADVARGIGMQSPSTLLLPYGFIPRLQVINEHTLRPMSALAFTRVTEIRQSGQSARPMDIVLTSALVILIVGCVVGYSVRAETASDSTRRPEAAPTFFLGS